MLDFRLKVFYTVALHLSFTKAAEELFISQPAVTKNIKELENVFGLRLFERKANKISLTAAGEILMGYAEEIKSLYQQIEFDFGVLKNKFSGILQLGASTTVGQYILPSVLAKFYKSFPEVRLSMLNSNTSRIEKALLEKKIELGIVEGKKHNNQLKYLPFIKDEIVAIVRTKSTIAINGEIKISDLESIPVVCRERGSGSLEVLEDALYKKKFNIASLNILMHLGSTESIKTFLLNYDCLGFVSIASVSKEIMQGEFRIVEIKDLEITREFSFVHLQGKPSGLAESFMQFALRSYNQK
ncbi:LysR family transcriptional regulator [Arachidicoccus soli]|uniref:LysR family transcriptional regulator n=1 Tax=Arachidicoccus soli TaxID=2341117 RepID=A0A386HMG2_9BACT|nr:LysR family transcriptional regulator [Arachidicoccus soli]AYD46806.1 LysR family transcriptional regulator [Arachidicoccus soli]